LKILAKKENILSEISQLHQSSSTKFENDNFFQPVGIQRVTGRQWEWHYFRRGEFFRKRKSSEETQTRKSRRRRQPFVIFVKKQVEK
jgi:hypothetical protein